MRQNPFIFCAVWAGLIIVGSVLAAWIGQTDLVPGAWKPAAVGCAYALFAVAGFRLAPMLAREKVDLSEPATDPNKPPKWLL